MPWPAECPPSRDLVRRASSCTTIRTDWLLESQRCGVDVRGAWEGADDSVARSAVSPPAGASASAPAGASAFAPPMGLTNTQRARLEVSPVQFGDGVVRGVVVHFDKAKASGTSRFAVGDYPCGNHLTVGGKKFRQFLVSRRPREVSNVDLLHWVSMIRFAAHCLAVQLGLRPPGVKTPAFDPMRSAHQGLRRPYFTRPMPANPRRSFLSPPARSVDRPLRVALGTAPSGRCAGAGSASRGAGLTTRPYLGHVPRP